MYGIAKIPCVQRAWVTGKQLRIHGLVYQMENGVLKDLGLTLNKLEMVPEEFWIYDNKLSKDLKLAYEKIFKITKLVPQLTVNPEDPVPENWTVWKSIKQNWRIKLMVASLYNFKWITIYYFLSWVKIKKQNYHMQNVFSRPNVLINEKTHFHRLVIFFFKCNKIVSL